MDSTELKKVHDRAAAQAITQTVDNLLITVSKGRVGSDHLGGGMILSIPGRTP
jgi:hypothetical protein